MNDLVKPVDVGFAEFMAKLISEVFDSVVAAQAEQEERLVEMTEAVVMDPALFADRFVSDNEVTELLGRLFPPRPEDESRGSAIYAGSPYAPAKDDIEESPPVFGELQIELKSGTDFRRNANRQRIELLAPGVDRIRSAAAQLLAESRQQSLARLMERGVPRVLVDSGKVNGKLTFSLVQPADNDEESNGSDSSGTADATGLPTLRTVSPDLFRSRFVRRTDTILPKTRVLVRQADERSPQSSNSSTNVYGEVEITFKTVT